MLTRSQFDTACHGFIAKNSESPATNAFKGWTWNKHALYSGLGFMSRTAVHYWRSQSTNIDEMTIDDSLVESCLEEEASTMPPAFDSLVSQQYVIYSATFQVPAFYFIVHDSKGVPLSLADLLRTSLFHPYAFENTEATNFGVTRLSSSFPLLSLGDHPTLGSPCWYLHPCETDKSIEEIMSELPRTEYPENTRLVRWLEAWFMVVGTAVNFSG